jgi:isopentenyl phosphate kinase
MATKVQQCLQMIAQNPQLEMFIFSGEEPEAVQRALSGEKLGTWLHGI